MRKYLTRLFIPFLVILTTPSLLKAQSPDAISGTVLEIEVLAPALTGNLLETPDTQRAAIFLPPGYANEPLRQYPVVYLLHGIFDDYNVWLENVDVPAILNRLIRSGEIPELVVVMPNGGNQYGGGFYRNSPVSGRWGDYIAHDLVEYIDKNFRTQPSSDSRAVVGHSMGGYGALNMVMSHPGVFSVAWALSPCCLVARDDLSIGNDAWKRAAQITTPEDVQNLFENRDYYPIAVLGVVTAFSPAPNTPPMFGKFPFDIIRGEVVPDDPAYDSLLDAMPLRNIHASREALRNLRGLAIGVGLGDQFLHIPTGAIEFSQHLGEQRIPHLLDVYAGDHRQLVAERLETQILPWVTDRLTVAE